MDKGVVWSDDCGCGWVVYICCVDFHIIVVWGGREQDGSCCGVVGCIPLLRYGKSGLPGRFWEIVRVGKLEYVLLAYYL